MTILVAGGLILGFSVFGRQVVKEVKEAEVLALKRSKRLRKKLRAKIGDFVDVTFHNGTHKKGYLRDVRKHRIILDSTKPKRVGGLWVCLDSEISKINTEEILLEAVDSVKTVLGRRELTYYRF